VKEALPLFGSPAWRFASLALGPAPLGQLSACTASLLLSVGKYDVCFTPES
jgi:hypothetical protein